MKILPLLTLLVGLNVAAQDNDSCLQATPFAYFHCESYPPATTYSATLCYQFHTSGAAVDFNFGYFAYCPDLTVEYTLYNMLCDSITSNTTGYFDIAPEVYYVICGKVGCTDTTGLGIAQVCTTELLALPVEFLGLTSYATDAGVVLSWATATERGSDSFEVFRMRTELDRGTLLTSLRAAGYSLSRMEYRWTDVEPEAGLHFYRLEGVDLDGSRRVLSIVPVTWTRPDRSSLGPWDILGRRVRPE